MNLKANFKKIRKKSIALILTLALTVSVFAACNPSAGNGPSGDKGADGRTDLVYGIAAEPNSIDPMTIAMMSSFTVTYALYDTLFELQDNGTYEPSLAESVTVSEDGLEYLIPIKQGVKFHDNSELKAKDVVFSINRTIEKGWAADMTAAIDSVTLADENTVKITLSRPFSGMVGSLASPFFSIMSENYVTTKGDDAIKREPMGTGAYKMTEWVAGDHITLTANEDYFGGAPSIKKVTIKPIVDKNTGLIALENKEIDVFLNVNSSDIATVKENKDLAFYSSNQAAVLSLNMNIEKKPLDDVKVRKAISHAINKENIIVGALENIGTIAKSAIPPVVAGYTEDAPSYEYNIEKAKQLLKEAGFEKLNLTMKIKEDAKSQKVAQIIQADLKEAGIDVTIEVMEAGAFNTDIYANGNYEITVGSWSAMFLDAYSVVYSQFHKDCYGPTGNITHVVSDELSDLLDKASQANEDNKVEAYQAVIQNIYENAYNIPLVVEETNITTNAALKGVKANPLGVYMLKNFSS